MTKDVEKDAGAFAAGGEDHIEKLRRDFAANPFGRKRLWCSLRDYLKSPEFNGSFVEALKGAGLPDVGRWRKDDADLKAALGTLELPGDVWNNSPLFRKGLFTPRFRNERKTWDMPRTAREIYRILRSGGPLDAHPEQLDVTFDFVPRMCERQMCSVCLFGDGVDKVCHGQSGLLCSVALLACGYSHECNPGECRLRENRVKDLCHSHAGR